MSENTAVATIEKNEIAGFSSASAFELLMRQAKLISSSSLVPEQFSIFDKNGKLKSREDQNYALSNATIAMEMAGRIGASPLMVCQNLYIVHGRPGWSSQFIIACINSSGRFSPLRFDITGEGDGKTCVAWAEEKGTGQRLESPPVSIGMAKEEGWYGKNGSKWKTMPDLMLRYRSAAFFGRIYAPDLMMGIKPVEELQDVIDIKPEPATNHSKAAEIASRFEEEKVIAADQATGEVAITAEEVQQADPGVLHHVYIALADAYELTGELPDDMVDRLTNGKYGDRIALESAPDDVLNDLLASIKAAKKTE